MIRVRIDRVLVLHLGIVVLLFLLQFVLPEYHHANLSRIMVFATFALGYNLLLGYTGLLSLGHAMFFAAGMYGAGLTMQHLGWSVLPAFLGGVLSGFVLATLIGLLALRTTGVSFMIVTMMFAQAGFLATLFFGKYTRGDEGFVLQQAMRQLDLGGLSFDLTQPDIRYFAALILFSCCLLISLFLVRSPAGRVFVSIRENEDRSRMLGYDPFRYKLLALVVSGCFAAAAGAAYGILFGFVGSTFASIQYSIFPLLWVLLGGVGTILGPFLGTLVMFYLTDIASSVTSAHLLVVGAALVLLILWFPKGILGTLRERVVTWLP